MEFQKDVIEKSYAKPVLVDFWASWCAPCRMLGPVIGKIAEEQSDKWDLVKLSTEEHPEIAEQYHIRSIPNVKLFYKGEVINEFSGALSRTAILGWLEKNLPDDRKEQLQALLQRRTEANVEKELAAFVEANPDLIVAKVALAELIVFDQPEEAVALVAAIKMGDKEEEQANRIRTIAELLSFEATSGQPVSLLLKNAQDSLRNQAFEAAVKYLIEATTADKTFAKDLPRRAAIALFQCLGDQHELTKNYRWKFDMVLY
jgi:putative thioredoxin